MRPVVLALAAPLTLQGCFLFNTATDDAGFADAQARDASSDAAPDSPDASLGDAGTCPDLGETRLCAPLCGVPCPPLYGCSDLYATCYDIDADPRGNEQCQVNLEFGGQYCYRGARLCAVHEGHRSPGDRSWGGVCVSDEYCRWVQTEPSLEDIRCRYSEGTLFEDGPPDHPCGVGAHPSDPFCGGRCGDTCSRGFIAVTPACVGISETRGFGVCVRTPRPRCSPEDWDHGATQLDECQLAGFGESDCVCMLLSPVELPEYSERGWAVATQTCLAYRERYPGEVRCYDRTGLELESGSRP